MIDTRLALMAGVDIPVPECQLVIHQPTLREIAMMGEREFFIGVQTLCLHKSMFVTEDQDESDLADITNFQIFMTIMSEPSTQDKKDAVVDLLQLICPNFKVSFLPQLSQMLLIGNGTTIRIDNENFDVIQKVCGKIFCQNEGPMDQQAFNPANERAKEIAQKLMRGRQRVAEQKGLTNVSVFTQYISTLTIGLNSMSLKDLLNCTMFQLYDLIERYSLWVAWDLDVRSRLAGAKPDSQPDNWMKNLH